MSCAVIEPEKRVTVGKKTLEDGAADVRDRKSGEERRVPIGELGGIL
jgi:glycyl-tRNA synthetase (class II)